MRAFRLGRIVRNRTPGEVLSFVVAAVLVVGTCGYACLQVFGDYDYDLQRGYRVMYQMMGEKTLEKAGFFDAHPEGTPSEFVEFVDSEEAETLWPPTDRQWRDRYDHPDLMDDPERALSPDDLDYVAGEPDPKKTRQMVYFSDDEAGTVELRGYLNPDDEPIDEWSVEFPSEAEEIEFE